MASTPNHRLAPGAATRTDAERFFGLFTARVCWQILLLALLFVALYHQEFRRLFVKWLTPDWSHGFVVPLISLVFVYVKRERLLAAQFRPTLAGLPVLLAGIGLYGASVYVQVGYTQSLSMVIVIYGLVLLMCGWEVTRIVWFPIFFLLFALPLPDRYYVALTMPLRKISSAVAAPLLSTVIPSIEAKATGTVIDYYDGAGGVGKLDVERACAGMRLIMAFGALGMAMAWLVNRSLWYRLVLVASIVPIAVICNIVRVTITGVFVVTGHPDLAQGTPHALLGLAMLAMAFGLLRLVCYTMDNLFIETASERLEDEPAGR